MNTIIAWTGAGFFLIAYSLLTFKKLEADKPLYQLLNIFGGLCLATTTFLTGDYASFFTNALWMCIGLLGICNSSGLFRSFKLQ